MAVITVTGTNELLDALGAYAVAVIGSSTSGHGYGVLGEDWGAYAAVLDVEDALLALTDLEPIGALVAQSQTLKLVCSGIARAGADASGLLGALQSHVTRQAIPGVRTLDDYLVWRNTGEATKWQCQQAPIWRSLSLAWNPSGAVSPAALYFEVLQGATYANGLGKLVVGGAFTAGHAISALYSGGWPQLKVSGLTGTDVVTVTGTAFNPATQALVTGRTWTATVTADGVTALAPGGGSAAPAGSLIAAVTGISAAAGISAGTIYAEAARPTGRPLIS